MSETGEFLRRHPSEQARVLIVEPKRDYSAVLAKRIAEAGFRVITADSPQSAMAELHRAPVSIVLAELMMPNNGGLELVRMIRDDSILRDIPVLMITAKSDRSAEVRAIEAGADATIRKPFHFEVLLARLSREIERTRALQHLRKDNAALDARVVERSIELDELRSKWVATENERLRLQRMLGNS